MTVQRYRKKPVVIEAFQINSLEDCHDCAKWVKRNGGRMMYDVTHGWFIYTLEGKMHISLGDYVIKGSQGEFYPCKPNAFTTIHELAE